MDHLECPYCGDRKERPESPLFEVIRGKIVCDQCGGVFFFRGHVKVEYETWSETREKMILEKMRTSDGGSVRVEGEVSQS